MQDFGEPKKLAEMNEPYMITGLAPAILAIGSNGGGEAYAFDRRTAEPSLVLIPLVCIELDEAIPIAKSFHGMAGLIAAPIYYAYLKRELIDADLI